MPGFDLNIIVCVDERRCLNLESSGRDSLSILEGLRTAIKEHDLEGSVQATACSCIFGCTYGPRIDVAKRWSGEKVLYGIREGKFTISVRGTVQLSKIPVELIDLALDNLPKK